MQSSVGVLTQLFDRMRSGDQTAEAELFDRLYGELKAHARYLISAEARKFSLSPTALVNSAWIRLRTIQPESVQDHRHFVRLATRAMRRLLIDEARKYKTQKRAAGERVDLSDSLLCSIRQAELLIDLNTALEQLRETSPRSHDVFELAYFGGYTHREIAEFLEISERSVTRHWVIARTRLRGSIDGDDGTPAE